MGWGKKQKLEQIQLELSFISVPSNGFDISGHWIFYIFKKNKIKVTEKAFGHFPPAKSNDQLKVS